MSAYDLKRFCADCHDALIAEPGTAGREAVRRNLERLLANPDFIAEHVQVPAKKGRTLLYHDADTDFYVLAHGTPEGNKIGKPHDHGASWAVYGQATGVTEMTVWRCIDGGGTSGQVEIEPARRFTLEPGRAALFDTGTIHNTAHPRPGILGADHRHRSGPDRALSLRPGRPDDGAHVRGVVARVRPRSWCAAPGPPR